MNQTKLKKMHIKSKIKNKLVVNLWLLVFGFAKADREFPVVLECGWLRSLK